MAGEPKLILATDCGSTTTKAVLIERGAERYRLVARGEAPTTVEAPFDDVTVGVLNAVREVEELTGVRLLAEGRVKAPREGGVGADLFLSTSSAGGGLQMVVAGVVKRMTAESAERAALGAGAIVMEVLAVDDGRRDFERIRRIRSLRPDIILLSGGTDGGTTSHVVEMAEVILAANPRPRLGREAKLPIIYAGNKDAREEVSRILGKIADLHIVDNIRPRLEVENLGPARAAIHEVFLQHVMRQAPGYDKLLSWVSKPIMPTPMAVGILVETLAKEWSINVMAVDIGGATTDVFSVFGGRFTRTVSANLGLSYSICNVLAEAGVESILRWLPYEADPDEVRNRLRNKMIRPTTIPQTKAELWLEQAVAREALRLALEHHKQLAAELKGVQRERTIAEVFTQEVAETLVDMMKVNLIVGSGGVLSHAPQRQQAALMLLDSFQPEGLTELAVDSIFMMPHLGVLTTAHLEAAMEVFWNDCLIMLGTCLAPKGSWREGEELARLLLERPDGTREERVVKGGDLFSLPLEGEGKLTVEPLSRVDFGEGRGKGFTKRVRGGVVGLIVDARGRPLTLPASPERRREAISRWMRGLGVEP
ncbi:MAG TPA: methylaspartate mutase [Armatimonadetes bacterium]|nr:methylaspartate mutase [Armatimonadota bacterium]